MSSFNQIVWLSSYPKSGNTWLRLFLDAYFLNELDINEVVTSVPDDIAVRHQIGDGSDIVDMPLDIQTLTRPMALLRLVRRYQDSEFKEVPLYVKTHNANMVANGIELLPQSLTKFTVYLVRDPRDVLCSFSKHVGMSIDETFKIMKNKLGVLQGQGEVESKVADFISSWDRHVQSFLDGDNNAVMIVKYEELKADPEKIFSQILKWTGVEPDAERVRNAIEMTRLEQLKEREKSDGFRESSPYAKNQFFGDGGGWRDKLTTYQAKKVEREFGRAMKRLGYK